MQGLWTRSPEEVSWQDLCKRPLLARSLCNISIVGLCTRSLSKVCWQDLCKRPLAKISEIFCHARKLFVKYALAKISAQDLLDDWNEHRTSDLTRRKWREGCESDLKIRNAPQRERSETCTRGLWPTVPSKTQMKELLCCKGPQICWTRMKPPWTKTRP